MNVKLVWATPDAEKLLSYMARVSNPANQDNPSFSGLIRYMIRNKHWSPFEMVSACVEIETTRDIARQILRHRSFSFQEFSQRYADVASSMPPPIIRETRMQDTKNRQSSLACTDAETDEWFRQQQMLIANTSATIYREALARGIAKEQARSVLPEGTTPSRMYMAGTLRSWLHYCAIRTDASTQLEHREIAQAISDELAQVFPVTWGAARD